MECPKDLFTIKNGNIIHCFNPNELKLLLSISVTRERFTPDQIKKAERFLKKKAPAKKNSFFSSKNVKQLKPSDFSSNVNLKNKKDSIVLFFAPWCPHCVSIKETWSSFADEMKKKRKDFSVCSMDCQEHKEFSKNMSGLVQGFPTLYIYKNGKPVQEYSGARDLNSLVSYFK